MRRLPAPLHSWLNAMGSAYRTIKRRALLHGPRRIPGDWKGNEPKGPRRNGVPKSWPHLRKPMKFNSSSLSVADMALARRTSWAHWPMKWEYQGNKSDEFTSPMGPPLSAYPRPSPREFWKKTRPCWSAGWMSQSTFAKPNHPHRNPNENPSEMDRSIANPVGRVALGNGARDKGVVHPSETNRANRAPGKSKPEPIVRPWTRSLPRGR